MEFLLDAENQIETWQEVTLVYNAAVKQINTKLEILNDEFQHVHQYNPIEHIKSRIKTSESIVKKMKREMKSSGVKVVATGGFSEIIASEISCIDHVDKLLTLQGLKYLYDLNNTEGKQ